MEEDQPVTFSIFHCTSSDKQHPVENLVIKTSSEGWQTERSSNYPQELVLKLSKVTKIKRLLLLVHEFKIPKRVEIFLSCPEIDGQYDFKRLGYVNFDSNSTFDYTVRELKTIVVEKLARYIRIIVHECHHNKLNTYNQVGIAQLGIYGKPIEEDLSTELQQLQYTASQQPTQANYVDKQQSLQEQQLHKSSPNQTQNFSVKQLAILQQQHQQSQPHLINLHQNQQQQQQQQHQQQYTQNGKQWESQQSGHSLQRASSQRQTNLSEQSSSTRYGQTPTRSQELDSVTAQQVFELTKQKQLLVDEEDYDGAKRLKLLIMLVREYGHQISVINAKKQQAVEDENYDLAKRYKEDITQLRQKADQEIAGHSKLISQISNNASTQASTSRRSQELHSEAQELIKRFLSIGAMQTNFSSQSSLKMLKRLKTLEQDLKIQVKTDPLYKDSLIKQIESIQQFQQSISGPPGHLVPQISSQDNLPKARVLNEFGIDNQFQQQLKNGDILKHKQSNRTHTKSPNKDTHIDYSNNLQFDDQSSQPSVSSSYPPPGWPSNLPKPDQQGYLSHLKIDGLYEVVGRYVTDCFYSSNVQLRQTAVYFMKFKVEDGGLKSMDRNSFGILSRASIKGLQDNQLILPATELLLALVQKYLSTLGYIEVQQTLVIQGIQQMLDKLGSVGRKANAKYRDSILELAKLKELKLESRADMFLKDLGRFNTLTDKQILERQQLVLELLPSFGLYQQSSQGFDIVKIMEVVKNSLQINNHHIQSYAVQIIIETANIYGEGVQDYLPKELSEGFKQELILALKEMQDSDQQSEIMSRFSDFNLNGDQSWTEKKDNGMQEDDLDNDIDTASDYFKIYNRHKENKTEGDRGSSSELRGDMGVGLGMSKEQGQQQYKHKNQSRSGEHIPAYFNHKGKDSMSDFLLNDQNFELQSEQTFQNQPKIDEQSSEDLSYLLSMDNFESKMLDSRKALGRLPSSQRYLQFNQREHQYKQTGQIQEDYYNEDGVTQEMNQELQRAETVTQAQKVLKSRLKVFGEVHVAISEAYTHLGTLLLNANVPSDAEIYYQKAMEVQQKIYGADHVEIGHTLVDLALCKLSQHKDSTGKLLLERAYHIQRKNLGANNPDVIQIKEVLDSCG